MKKFQFLMLVSVEAEGVDSMDAWNGVKKMLDDSPFMHWTKALGVEIKEHET
jgi:hypothetical protein